MTDALGRLVRFKILPGQAHGPDAVPSLLEGLPFEAFTGDKASGAGWLPGDLKQRGAQAVIPARRNRTKPRKHGREMCGWRHTAENFFAKTREVRSIATRYDKTGESFTAGIYLIAGVIAAR